MQFKLIDKSVFTTDNYLVETLTQSDYCVENLFKFWLKSFKKVLEPFSTEMLKSSERWVRCFLTTKDAVICNKVFGIQNKRLVMFVAQQLLRYGFIHYKQFKTILYFPNKVAKWIL